MQREFLLGGTRTVKQRKPLVHRLILNEHTFLSPQMTSTLQEISPYQSKILSSFSCSSSSCLRNRSLINTEDFLRLDSYSHDNRHRNYICPLEKPFPFYHSHSLRTDFFQQAHIFLPQNLHILLTTSSSIIRSSFSLPIEAKHPHLNNILEYLFNYAYTKWNRTSNQFDFDQQALDYHQQIIAPLLEYAKYIFNERSIHIVERHSKKYQSELPLTFGYVLAPSLSVFNQTFLEADEDDRRESRSMMDLFANLIHNG